MKLVQKSLMAGMLGICGILFAASAANAQDPSQPEYTAHYNPAKGFKPAQANLTEIFLQLAGSLEHHGSPESYIRHMQKEHERVSRLYEQKTGKKHNSRLPSHMTDDYVERLIRNWNVLAAPLGLSDFAKEIGDFAREGIMGTRLSGTIAVELFNQHQKSVLALMTGESTAPAGFEELRMMLVEKLEFGKEMVSTKGYETSRRDAVSYASSITDRFIKMFKKIDEVANPSKAGLMKEAVLGVFLDLGHLAQSELEIGILELSLRNS
mgnify:CR=1 FL=1